MQKHFFYSFLIVFCGTACNHKYYAPNKVNTPFLETVGESQISVGAYTADEFTGFNVQGTYRPMHNLVAGIHLFSAASNQNQTTVDGAPNTGKGYLGELCLGPYWQIGDNLAVSVLLGGGFGKTKHEYGFDQTATLSFQRQFIQPTLKYRRNHFSLGSGLRLCRLDYTSGNVNAAIDRDELNTILAIDAKSPFYLPELGINVGFVGKHMTIEYSITNLLFDKNYDYRFADRAIGLDFSFNTSKLRSLFRGRRKTD